MKIKFNLPANTAQIIVGYSGGLDSHCLLDYLAKSEWANKLLAIHINHGISSNALQWQEHCVRTCAEYGIPLQTHAIKITPQNGESLEALARTVRYDIFRQAMSENSVLMTAHHQDDQAETVLLSLLRGAGVAGLAAMPLSKSFGSGLHVRPLLNISRAKLESYAREQELKWIEDESNAVLDYDRNYLRHEILPRLQQRWPAAAQTIARSAEHAGQALMILNELAIQDLVSCAHDPQTSRQPSIQVLEIPVLQNLSSERRDNVLRYWLRKAGCTIPSQAFLQRIVHEVVDARADADPIVEWPGGIVRRFQNRLYAFTSLPDPLNGSYSWDWQAGSFILGNLQIKAVTTEKFGLDCRKLPQQLMIQFRQGGEAIKPYPNQQTKTLKNLFQEWKIPTWERDRIPLFYAQDVLIAVGDYCYNTDYVTTEAQDVLGLKIG